MPGQAPPRPVIVRTQLAPTTITLGFGDKRASLPLQLDHVVDELDRDAEMRGYHPQTQGKIERWDQTLKNRILLENYFLPGDLKAKIGRFVAYYNHHRYHESLSNLTPADVYFGRGETILLERERIK